MSNTRERQFGIKLEAAEGTAETLAAADYAGNFKNIEFSYSIGQYDRELLRGTLSKDPALKGSRLLTVKSMAEVVGGTATVQSKWMELVQACGFARSQLKKVTVGTVTNGPFAPGMILGDNAVQGSATKTGLIVAYVPGSPNKVFYQPLTGIFANADNVFGYASPNVTATISATPVDAGHIFKLQSEVEGTTPKSATVECRAAGEVHTIVGGRGKFSINVEHDKPILLDAEFMGPASLDLSGALPKPVAAALVASVPLVGVAPRMGLGFPVLLEDNSPVWTQIKIDIDNTLAKRANGGTSTVSSGFMPTRISGRTVKCSIDPEKPVVATKEWAQRFLGTSTFPLTIQCGLASDTNGMTVIYAPAAQPQGDYSEGDREGVVTIAMELALTGTSDDETWIAQVYG